MLAQGLGPGQEIVSGQGLQSLSVKGSDGGGRGDRRDDDGGGGVVKCTLGVPLAHPRITTITHNNNNNNNNHSASNKYHTTPTTNNQPPSSSFVPPRLLQVILVNNAIGETGARALVEVALLPVTQGGFLVDDATLLAQGQGLGGGQGLASGPGLGLASAQGPGPGPGLAVVSDPLGLPLLHNNLTLRLSLLNLQYNGVSKRAQEKLHRLVGWISTTDFFDEYVMMSF